MTCDEKDKFGAMNTNLLRWMFILIFLIVTIISSFDLGDFLNDLMPSVSVLLLCIVVLLHAKIRYGIKNTLVFLLITFIVSLFFEALSIRIGFPFGHYYYDKLIGPRLFDVPLIIMLGYFSMAYVSWILSNVFVDQYNRKLSSNKVFLVPFVATFIMVIWDLCMDPTTSTVASLWVWKEGGSYFGVPLQNYFGWFFVVYIIFQSFAIYISKNDLGVDSSKSEFFLKRSYWLEASALYGIQGLSFIIASFVQPSHFEIFGPMALVSIFSMMFLTLLSVIVICNTRKA